MTGSLQRHFPAVILQDRNNIQVNARGKAPVQTKFFLTIEFPFFQRREIEESEIDGFFYFVNVVTGNKDVRNVRLDKLNRLRFVGVKIRPGHAFDNAGMTHMFLRE